MLCLEDCLALCDLSEEEVLAIAQHEHIPEIAAAELGNYLVQISSSSTHVARNVTGARFDREQRAARAGA